MPHDLVADLAAAVTVQEGSVVSKVVHRDADLNVSVFAFDAGEGLTEHTAARAAIVQVVHGRLAFTVDGEEVALAAGAWLHMAPGTPHALTAVEPTVMLLTMIRPE